MAFSGELWANWMRAAWGETSEVWATITVEVEEAEGRTAEEVEEEEEEEEEVEFAAPLAGVTAR